MVIVVCFLPDRAKELSAPTRKEVLPPVALKQLLQKMSCQLHKANCHIPLRGYFYEVSKESQIENVHLTSIFFVKCGWPYFYKSLCKTKIPEAIMNEIRISSFLRPRQSKREAARQLTSHGKNAQNIFFRFQYYKHDFSHPARAQ